MIRNLKVLGLAIAAVMAMGAVMASTAMAVPQFTASSYPAQVTGSNTKGNEKFTTDAGSVECDSHFLSASLGGASSTLTVTPTYTNCDAFGGFLNATVTTHGCTYVFHATEQVSAGVYRHHVDVTCPAGKAITVDAGPCAAEIKPQNGLTTVKTTNLAGGTVTVQPEVTGIAYHTTRDNFGCGFKANNTTYTNGAYTGDVVVSRVGGGTASVSGS